MINSVVPSGSYISEIVKFDTVFYNERVSEMDEILPDAESDRFPVIRNGLRSRHRRDIRSVGRCYGDQGDVARIKMGDNLSCASSSCKEQDRIVNFFNIYRLEVFLLSQNRTAATPEIRDWE